MQASKERHWSLSATLGVEEPNVFEASGPDIHDMCSLWNLQTIPVGGGWTLRLYRQVSIFSGIPSPG